VNAGPSESSLRPRRSAAWSLAWRTGYRIVRLIDPLIRSWVANGLPGLGGVVEIRTPGRRTGRVRRTLVTLILVEGGWYVGHPNGEAGWVRNAEAAGAVDVEPAGRHGSRFSVHRLPGGPERDAVIRATGTQQPFPANVLYRAARSHIAAVGVYHRLDPIHDQPLPAGVPTTESPGPSATSEGAR
jgi:hypothetical protein